MINKKIMLFRYIRKICHDTKITREMLEWLSVLRTKKKSRHHELWAIMNMLILILKIFGKQAR